MSDRIEQTLRGLVLHKDSVAVELPPNLTYLEYRVEKDGRASILAGTETDHKPILEWPAGFTLGTRPSAPAGGPPPPPPTSDLPGREKEKR